MAKKVKELVIEISLLKRIAEYYEFPFVVFLGNLKVFKEKTRKQSILKQHRDFERELIELIDKYFH